VKSNKNEPENSLAKPLAQATHPPLLLLLPRLPLLPRPPRPPREPETARAARAAAAAGATFPRPETSVRAIRQRGRLAGRGEGAATRAEAARPARELRSAATEAALARRPVNS